MGVPFSKIIQNNTEYDVVDKLTQAMIAQPFSANKTGGYVTDDIVTNGNKLYKFTSAHSGVWTGLDVEQIDVVETIDEKVDSVNSALAWQDITSQCDFNSGLTYVFKKVLARKNEVLINFSVSPTNWVNGAYLLKLPNDIPVGIAISGNAIAADGTPISEPTYICKPASGDLIDRTLIGYKNANTGFFVCTIILPYDN